MIVRAADYELPAYNGEFADVSDSDWYAGYLAAAYDNGIIEGDDNGNANPRQKLTREEMAKIMVSLYEQLSGSETAGGSADFADTGDISSWAVPYVAAAQELGLINGMEDGTFMPKQYALREQAIVVLYRMLEKLK